MFIDSHAHLFDEAFSKDIQEVLERSREAGVETIIVPGTTFETSRRAIELAEKHDSIYACVGFHPHDSAKSSEKALREIEELSKHPRVVAIGEMGLDFHYDFSPRDVQRDVFRNQVEIAIRRDLPIVVHTRESISESIGIVREAVNKNPHWRTKFRNPHGHLPPPRGVFHCFTGTAVEVWELWNLGFHVSYPGIVTFKNSPVLETLENTGFDHILLETDAPYLAPVPFRGKRNEPAHIPLIARTLAELFNVTVEDIARTARHNTKRLFQIGPPEPSRIAYKLRNSLYLNITNRCNADCSFCDRRGDAIVKGYSLKLDYEPTAEEVIAAIGDPTKFEEVVFCGYGEPTIRLDLVKNVAAWVKAKGVKVRLNTDGHGNIINKRDIVPELVGLIDAVSISINTVDPDQYAKMMQVPAEPYFSGMMKFARECVKSFGDVSMTVVDLSDVDIDMVKRLVERDIGATFRLRPYF